MKNKILDTIREGEREFDEKNKQGDFQMDDTVDDDMSMYIDDTKLKSFQKDQTIKLLEAIRDEIKSGKLIEVAVDSTALMWKQRFNNQLEEVIVKIDSTLSALREEKK